MLRRFRKDGVPFLLYSKLNSLPLEGKRSVDTVVNDSPVDCQSRGVTEPQREGGRRLAPKSEGV